MSQILAALAGNQVLGTGNIIGRSGSEIILTPFPDQPNYTIRVSIILAQDSEGNKSSIIQDGLGVFIEHKQIYNPLSPTVMVNGTVFGTDNVNSFVINYRVTITGKKERFSFDFGYTIYVEASQ